MTDHAKLALLDLKAHQQSDSNRLCPRCGRDTMKENLITNALSRHADIYICDECGIEEAILDYMHASSPVEAWTALLQKR